MLLQGAEDLLSAHVSAASHTINKFDCLAESSCARSPAKRHWSGSRMPGRQLNCLSVLEPTTLVRTVKAHDDVVMLLRKMHEMKLVWERVVVNVCSTRLARNTATA